MTAKVLDSLGHEINNVDSVCVTHQPIDLVWDMTSTNSTLNALAERPQLDDTTSPSLIQTGNLNSQIWGGTYAHTITATHSASSVTSIV